MANENRTLADIVAAVPMPPALKVAEQTFQQLRSRRSDALEEMRALIASKPRGGATQDYDTQIAALNKSADDLVDAIEEARAARLPHRRAYGVAVMAALAPARAAVAARVRAAVLELQEAADMLAETRVVIVQAGGEAQELPPVFLKSIVEVASVIERGENIGRTIGDYESMRVK